MSTEQVGVPFRQCLYQLQFHRRILSHMRQGHKKQVQQQTTPTVLLLVDQTPQKQQRVLVKHVSVLLHTVDWTLPSSSNRRYYCGLPFLRCVSLLFTEEVLHLRARSMLDLEARDICQGDLKLVRVVGISPSVSLETWNAHGKMLLLELRCC